MPFLRFSRDRRGYESTYLLHSARRRSDKDASSLLYWFRTPPHVKVGRTAFDEDTIRVLEDGHPDVEFDWPRILATKPLPAEPEKPARSGRGGPRRSEAGPEPPPERPPARYRPAPDPTPARIVPVPTPEPVLPPAAPVVAAALQMVEPDVETVPTRRFVRVFDAPASVSGGPEPADTEPADARPHHLSDPSAVDRALGSEELVRLRGQYAAALARIGSRVADPTLAQRLRAMMERANPDTWVTDADVRTGLSGLQVIHAELARYIGRRRRRRRGGKGPSSGSSGLVSAEQSGPEPAESLDEGDGRPK